jgi:thioredoxin
LLFYVGFDFYLYINQKVNESMENLTTITFRTKIFDYEKSTEWKYLGDKPCIIDYHASWCFPCKSMNPLYTELDKEYGDRIDFYKIDTEAESELSSVFKVRSIPTFIFIPVGGQPHMSNGTMPKNTFLKIIKEIFNI